MRWLLELHKRYLRWANDPNRWPTRGISTPASRQRYMNAHYGGRPHPFDDIQ